MSFLALVPFLAFVLFRARPFRLLPSFLEFSDAHLGMLLCKNRFPRLVRTTQAQQNTPQNTGGLFSLSFFRCRFLSFQFLLGVLIGFLAVRVPVALGCLRGLPEAFIFLSVPCSVAVSLSVRLLSVSLSFSIASLWVLCRHARPLVALILACWFVNMMFFGLFAPHTNSAPQNTGQLCAERHPFLSVTPGCSHRFPRGLGPVLLLSAGARTIPCRAVPPTRR